MMINDENDVNDDNNLHDDVDDDDDDGDDSVDDSVCLMTIKGCINKHILFICFQILNWWLYYYNTASTSTIVQRTDIGF